MADAPQPQASDTISPDASVIMVSPTSTVMGRPRIRVVVLGGGWAGVYTAKSLVKLLGKRDDVDIVLLNEENYFVFQPLLPEVAAGGIAATQAVTPIRELLPGVHFRCCKIQGIDFNRRRVLVTQGEGLSTIGVPYDHLVFCLGKVTSFASMPGVAEHSMAMKDVADAYELRNHVIRCLELADIEPDPANRQALLTFLVAGGGFSGVETIGEVCELVTRSLKYFPNIQKKDVLFKLVHAQGQILPEMSPKLRIAAQRVLEKRGIEMILNDRVRAASADRVYLTSGRVVHTRTFVCTVGNAPNPIARDAVKSGGFEEALFNGKPTGLFATDAHLRCLNKPGYWAVGDCAGVPDPSGKGLCPPTAQFAIRQGATCGENIAASINGKPLKKFSFKALGMLASLGQRSAVADIMGIKMGGGIMGFFAWMLWRFIYGLLKQPSNARRFRIAIDWFVDLLPFPRDLTQLSAGRRRGLNVHHYEPGEFIIREGQIGRELFMMQKGEVEVLQEAKPGRPEKVLAKLGPQSVFGEKALLEETRRTASVRAATPVDLLVMSRDDFRSFVSQFPVLEDYFANLRKPQAALPAQAPARSAAAAVAASSLADDTQDSAAKTVYAPVFVDIDDEKTAFAELDFNALRARAGKKR